MKLFAALIIFLVAPWCIADDSRPASITIEVISQQNFAVTWKVPYKGNQIPDLSIRFDEFTHANTPRKIEKQNNTLITRWRIQREQGLEGMGFEVIGLRGTGYQVLVRIVTDATLPLTALLDTEVTSFQFEKAGGEGFGNIVIAYTVLGFEHILIGWDHLLFVFSLVILISNVKALLLTITSFTLAHSLTLIAVSMGWMTVPGPPVEAAIALSIVFLARELVQLARGRDSLTATYPWVVAFAFGLLHGMGFAGALSDIGVPEGEAVKALLAFNVGVELGQVFFVVCILALMAMFKRIQVPVVFNRLPAYAIGTVSSFWLVERLAGF